MPKFLKFLFIFVVLLSIFLYFFLNPIAVYFIEKSLSKSMKQKVEITSLVLYPLELDGLIHFDTYEPPVKVHARYAGGLSLSPRSVGKVIITSTDLGGLVTIDYENYIYNIDVKDADFKIVAQILNDKKEYVESGVVNGSIVYRRKPRTGETYLQATEVVLNLPDIDKAITNVNDAININLFELASRNINRKNHDFSTTDVSHFQFNIEYKDDYITSQDVAFLTDNYRISLDANLHKKGYIDYFSLNLLDKNGCALVTREFTGNIRKPKQKASTSVITVQNSAQNIVKSAPRSFFSMGKQMMEYGNEYAEKQTGYSGPNKQMTSYIIKESDSIYDDTSKIVLPRGCKVVYRGLVTHPNNNGDSISSKSNRNKKASVIPPANIEKVEENDPTPYLKKIQF